MFWEQYEKIYASKLFSFSEMPQLPPNAIIGGTGIDFYNRLPQEIENAAPSYSLYPDCNYHLGFSMKGCRFNCKFCCVPKKEGRPWVDVPGVNFFKASQPGVAQHPACTGPNDHQPGSRGRLLQKPILHASRGGSPCPSAAPGTSMPPQASGRSDPMLKGQVFQRVLNQLIFQPRI